MSVNFNGADFEMSVGLASQLKPSDLPEIVFSGKSNVGKSTLINKLVNRKSLARVSSTPGKTATINSYLLPGCRFIDLPGYGYAKVSKSEKERWGKLVESYFTSGRNIKLVLQLLDMRHEPGRADADMVDYLIETQLPFAVALTKSDKLNKSETARQKEFFTELFNEAEIKFIPFSSVSGEGVEELRSIISEAAGNGAEQN